jgi:hypothetical protein
MALDLQELPECTQTTDWLTDRLPHVKSFVLNLYGHPYPDNELLKVCREAGVDDDDGISSLFLWLMKIGLPEYSILRFLDVRLFKFVKQQWRESISHPVEHFDRAEYYLTYDIAQSVDQFARDRKLLCCENLKDVSIIGGWSSVKTLSDLKFPLGIETIALQYYADTDSMVLDDLLEQCRNIKRLVIRCSINAYFKKSIPKSIEWLEVPDTFPSLRLLNLENIVKLRISVGQLKDLKLQGIPNLRDLTVSEDDLQNAEFYEVSGEILKSALTVWPSQRLEFGLNSEPLLKVLIESPSPMYPSLRSMSFGNVFKYLSGEEPVGHKFPTYDIKNLSRFVKT